MKSQSLVLEAARRNQTGKSAVSKLRRQGLIPAILYGGKTPISIQVGEKEANRLVKHLHGTTQMVTVHLPAADGQPASKHTALLKEVQSTPVGRHLLHMDFNEIDPNIKVRVAVEIHPVGTPVGVTFGGTMQVIMHEVMVECLPQEIPNTIEVDVSHLKIGHNLHVKDLTFPAGVTAFSDPGATVVVVSGRGAEDDLDKEIGPAVAPEAAEGEAPAAESKAS
ncbi:MAG: 50S ribosomal protein L25 [Deltaproteobacteria bacterium]|nr:50S ribosomal protein L25 [Deltaproteobacteria bacterium]